MRRTQPTVRFMPIPFRRIIPDGTGAYLPNPPRLTSVGAPLIVSNSPEQITGNSPLTILCRTMAPAWRFRLFFHHQNATGRPLRVGFALVNRSDRAIDIYMARNSGQPTNGPTCHNDPAVAGQNVLSTFFASRSVRTEEDRYVATIAPQGVYVSVQTVAGGGGGSTGQCVAGMCDLAFRYASGSGTESMNTAPLEVSTVAFDAAVVGMTPSLSLLTETPLAQPDAVLYQRTRGVYPHADRLGKISVDVPMNGIPRWLDIAGPINGPYARPLPNEYEMVPLPRGGGQLAHNPGNYGIVYDFEVILKNKQSIPIRMICLMNMAGGVGGSALLVNGVLSSPVQPSPLGAFHSWVWHESLLQPGATQTVRLRFSLPGGANGSHRLFFWPQAAHN